MQLMIGDHGCTDSLKRPTAVTTDSYTADSEVHIAKNNTSHSDGGRKKIHVTPIHRSQEASYRHITCDDKQTALLLAIHHQTRP